jgi:hypothetical protein
VFFFFFAEWFAYMSSTTTDTEHRQVVDSANLRTYQQPDQQYKVYKHAYVAAYSMKLGVR